MVVQLVSEQMFANSNSSRDALLDRFLECKRILEKILQEVALRVSHRKMGVSMR